MTEIEIPSIAFIKEFKKIPGALSVAESIAIFNVAKLAPEGIYLELGSHKGKSGVSALLGLKGGVFSAVDPIFENRAIMVDTLDYFEMFADKNTTIEFWDKYSEEVIPMFNDLSFVFLDTGSHGDGLPMREVKLLEDRIVSGGILCFHDYKNQFVEVEGAYNYLVSTGKYEVVPINWDLILRYTREHNSEDGNNSWHLYPELGHSPNFVGALRRK